MWPNTWPIHGLTLAWQVTRLAASWPLLAARLAPPTAAAALSRSVALCRVVLSLYRAALAHRCCLGARVPGRRWWCLTCDDQHDSGNQAVISSPCWRYHGCAPHNQAAALHSPSRVSFLPRHRQPRQSVVNPEGILSWCIAHNFIAFGASALARFSVAGPLVASSLLNSKRGTRGKNEGLINKFGQGWTSRSLCSAASASFCS